MEGVENEVLAQSVGHKFLQLKVIISLDGLTDFSTVTVSYNPCLCGVVVANSASCVAQWLYGHQLATFRGLCVRLMLRSLSFCLH